MVPTLIEVDGEIWLNELKRYAKGCVIAPPSATNPVVVAQNSLSGPVVVEGSQDGVSEVWSFQGVHGASDATDVQNRLAVVITEQATRRQLMNRQVLASQVFGHGQRPFRLCEGLLLDGQQTMVFEFYNNSAAGGNANFYMGLEGGKFQGFGLGHKKVVEYLAIARKRKAYLAPYWLTSDADISLAASGSTRAFFTNTSDKYLLIEYIMAFVITTGSAGNEAAERFEFLITDGKTKRQLSNQHVTLNTGCGTAQYPFRLRDPLIVEPSTQIMVEFNSLLTDQAQEIFFTFAGIQCFDTLAPFAPGQLIQPQHAGLPAGGSF
jgi:hypothetical protein